MSKRSRKKSRKPRSRGGKDAGARRRHAGEAETGAKGPEPKSSAFEIPDEVIHAPPQTSKWRFALMIALVVFLLIIFVVPTAFFSLAQGGPEDRTLFTWTTPGGDDVEVGWNELQEEHRRLEATWSVAPLVFFQLGLEEEPGPLDVARFMVLDRLAFESGVRVTEDALLQHLRTLIDLYYGQQGELYRQNARMVGVEMVEGTLRRLLRVQRFLQLAGFAGGVPDPSEIERAWRDEHVQVAFDHVSLPFERFEEQARAELPADEELEAWLSELPEWEQQELFLPERRAAEIVLYRDPETTPAEGLLAAYPPEEGPDAEEAALNYYNRVFARRFVRPATEAPAAGEPEQTGGSEETEAPAGDAGGAASEEEAAGATEAGEEAAAEPAERSEYLDFEEVRERALAEAPIYDALQAWLRDLRQRQEAGETLDLAAEAERFGLEHVAVPPLSREELVDHELLGTPVLVDAVFLTPPGELAYAVAATADALGIVHVTGTIERGLPPLDEIREDVSQRWIDQRARELALERLEEIRSGFPTLEEEELADEDASSPFPPEVVRRRASSEAFAAAAQELGLEVGHRPLVDRMEPPAPDAADDPFAALAAANRQLAYMVEGEVAPPQEGADEAWLVRLGERAEVPLERMTPADYERYLNLARGTAQQLTLDGVDLDFLRDHLGVVFDEEFAQEEEEEVEGEA